MKQVEIPHSTIQYVLSSIKNIIFIVEHNLIEYYIVCTLK